MARRHRAGFSLVELLAVMTALALLLGLAARSIRPPVSRSTMAAGQLARAFDLARSHALARNRTVWVHLTTEEAAPYDLAARFFASRDGSRDAAAVAEFRRPLRMRDLLVAADVRDLVERPDPRGTVRVEPGDWLVFKPDGQAYAGANDTDYPAAADSLAPVLEIGLRSTARGQVTKSTERDVAVVHLHGATGTSQVYEP